MRCASIAWAPVSGREPHLPSTLLRRQAALHAARGTVPIATRPAGTEAGFVGHFGAQNAPKRRAFRGPLACDGSGFRPSIRPETGRARGAPVRITLREEVHDETRSRGICRACDVGRAGQAQEVKVGLVAPFTGIGAELGQQIDRGMEQYLKLNADEVKPYKIKLIKRDVEGPERRQRQDRRAGAADPGQRRRARRLDLFAERDRVRADRHRRQEARA